MSASTGTIRRPMAGGSILGAIAIGVATLFAVGALVWGAANLTATKHVATAVAAPQYLDRGGRELPVAAPKAYCGRSREPVVHDRWQRHRIGPTCRLPRRRRTCRRQPRTSGP